MICNTYDSVLYYHCCMFGNHHCAAVCIVFSIYSVEIIKSHKLPAGKLFSASLHPSKASFVAGGEDFKLYKYNYNGGEEIGMGL